MLSDQDKQFLLKLARDTLENSIKNKESKTEDIPPNLLKKGATFVSLYIDNELKNSIGSLFQNQEIFQDVIENTISAASEDPNFPQITEADLDKVKIEISLVKNLTKLKFETEEELFTKIVPHIHGVILKKNNRVSTLLPQVWKQIPDKNDFLTSLASKLEANDYMINSEISTYETETFRED